MKQTAPEECRTSRGNIKYLNKLRPISRVNRNNPTLAEKRMWDVLLKRDKMGYSFLRQKSIGQFILDFYCSRLMLAVEIDGSSHNNKKSQDDERDMYLMNRGIVTIRYDNNQVINEIEKVDLDLKDKLAKRKFELKLS